MSFGKMNTFISIVEKQFTQDEDGFKTETDVTMAVRNGQTWRLFPLPLIFFGSE